ncbi:hypothetical protein SAMN05444159_6845 [Bradyrhizobium lablabi]|uniref:Uncharacterized protein n=1 Tax=Bradyrhizobium lablabi TaxID=722472 RepID=A0A1M7DJY4_9BRAD|nr:hypothetical protein SAMN05444159_6845 [Bradyrhizobium lablabi]
MIQRAKNCCVGSSKYCEKVTSRDKLLRRTARIRGNVTNFAWHLSKPPGNWLELVQSSAKMRLSLFFPN